MYYLSESDSFRLFSFMLCFLKAKKNETKKTAQKINKEINK